MAETPPQRVLKTLATKQQNILRDADVDVDKLLATIPDPDYHECEARFFCEAVGHAIFDSLAAEHGVPESNDWQKVTHATSKLLARYTGRKTTQDFRFGIDDPLYWSTEALFLNDRDDVLDEKRRKANSKIKYQRRGVRKSARLKAIETARRRAQRLQQGIIPSPNDTPSTCQDTPPFPLFSRPLSRR